MIPLFSATIPTEAYTEILNSLNSGWVGQGPKVDKFEKEFGKKFKQKYCIAMNSGSSALETAYELVGIKPGDEVISTPLTASPTNIPLLRMGAKIVWADIGGNLCLDREDVLKKITRKTKAIVNVHFGGVNNDLGEMPVPVISDSCQALGVFNGEYTCCSFQAIKHITTGDGGMLVVNNEEEYEKARLMRWFGIDRNQKTDSYKLREMTFDIETIGYKRQMNDIAASMGIVGLQYYNKIISYRKKIFNLYKRLLKVPVIGGDTYWLCQVLLENRDIIAQKLFENGIETNIAHIRNDAYKIFGGRVKLKTMDWVENKYLCLPLNMKVTEDDVIKISNLVNEYS